MGIAPKYTWGASLTIMTRFYKRKNLVNSKTLGNHHEKSWESWKSIWFQLKWHNKLKKFLSRFRIMLVTSCNSIFFETIIHRKVSLQNDLEGLHLALWPVFSEAICRELPGDIDMKKSDDEKLRNLSTGGEHDEIHWRPKASS